MQCSFSQWQKSSNLTHALKWRRTHNEDAEAGEKFKRDLIRLRSVHRQAVWRAKVFQISRHKRDVKNQVVKHRLSASGRKDRCLHTQREGSQWDRPRFASRLDHTAFRSFTIRETLVLTGCWFFAGYFKKNILPGDWSTVLGAFLLFPFDMFVAGFAWLVGKKTSLDVALLESTHINHTAFQSLLVRMRL